MRLLDLGFVKLLRAPKITGSEMVAGSPSYIAPETWLYGAANVNVQADVYSLGVMLFRAIAGRLPFDGATVVEQMVAVTSGPRPRIAAQRIDLSPDIDAWVQQALAIDRDDRFQSANGVFRAFCACFPGG